MSNGSTLRRQRDKLQAKPSRRNPTDSASDIISYPDLGVELSAGMVSFTIDSLLARVRVDGRFPRYSRAGQIVVRLYHDGWICRKWVNELVQPRGDDYSLPLGWAEPATAPASRSDA